MGFTRTRFFHHEDTMHTKKLVPRYFASAFEQTPRETL